MSQKIKRTISEVLNFETGEPIDANDFFKKPLDELTVFRSELQKAIEGFREPLFTCFYCKQRIRIRGGISKTNKSKSEIFHFAHLKDSEDCHIKTKNLFTKDEVNRIKYNGVKESVLHQTIKNQIADCLRLNENNKHEINTVQVEKVIRDKVEKEWKKPDVNAFFRDNHIAIELQLSTTWLDVITRRQQFYKEQGIYIFWIFHTFDINDDIRKLTYNDVVYTNNQNAYVFDKETYELSLAENDLILKCYYKSYFRSYQELSERWECSIIKLSDLTFEEKSYRIYFNNSEEQKKNIEDEIKEFKAELLREERIAFRLEQEIQKKGKEIKAKIRELNDDILSIIEYKKEITNNEEKVKADIKGKQVYLENIIEYMDKTVKYLTNSNLSYKPFYNYDSFLETLENEFTERLKTSTKIILEEKEKQESLTKNITAISKLKPINILGTNYSQINNWDYIKQNYRQIKVINKKFIEDLFVSDYLNDEIKDEYELVKFQYSQDNLFLMDFSEKTQKLIEQRKMSQNIVEEQEKNFADIKEQIKIKIEDYFQNTINELELKLLNYSNKVFKLDCDIAGKTKELIDIE